MLHCECGPCRECPACIDPAVHGRRCNGGPAGPWCGAPAELVCTDASGLAWFACRAHQRGAILVERLAAFLRRVRAL